MQTPRDILEPIKTRGDFRQVSGSAQDEQRSLDNKHPIWELWSIFSDYYGNAFISQYGEEPSPTWVYMLRDLTPAEYRKGIDLLQHRDSSYPPNPGEFLEMIGNDSSWERQCHKVVPAMLEDQGAKARRQETGLAMIRNLRKEVGL